MQNNNNNSSQKTSANAGTSQQASQSSSNTGSTIPQRQQGQNATAQSTGHYQQQGNQQQGHGHGQAQFTTGGNYGQPAATQHAQGSSLGSNTAQMSSVTSAQGQTQYPQQFRWRNAFPSDIQQQGNQQQGHGHGQAHFATGGHYGQPAAATQQVQGSSHGGNIAQMPSATSAQGQQTQYRWRNDFPPGNQQGAMGQGGSSSTGSTDLGVGAGPYGSTMSGNIFRYQRGGPPGRGNHGTGRSRGHRG